MLFRLPIPALVGSAVLLPGIIVLLFIQVIQLFGLVEQLQALYYPIIILGVASGVLCLVALPIRRKTVKVVLATLYAPLMLVLVWFFGFNMSCLVGGHCA